MVLSQHPMDHAQKRARSTNGLGGLGVRKLSACSSLHQARLSFFHAVSRVLPRNLLKKVKMATSARFKGRLIGERQGARLLDEASIGAKPMRDTREGGSCRG